MKKLVLILILACTISYGQNATGILPVGNLQLNKIERTKINTHPVVLWDSITKRTKAISRTDFFKGISLTAPVPTLQQVLAFPNLIDGKNFQGDSAGYQATTANNSNFLGTGAGFQATDAYFSNFMGFNSGWNAANANYSNFLGVGAGYLSTNAKYSNFLGDNSGREATNANNSNFLGGFSGARANLANNSNFFGYASGRDATNAYSSNFLGNSSGQEATNANNSNFLGSNAGKNATNASYSNFIGVVAGKDATNAFVSNFIGYSSGQGATAASYSNLFGYNSGKTFGSNNIGANNIIIGTNISLPNATANSINLGGVLFGTGTYSTASGNPSIVPSNNGKIGIGVVNPSEKLEVGGNIKANGVIRLKNYTVSTLPTGVQGDTAYVTDALAPSYLGSLTGGGSVVCPVFFNGVSWVSN